MKIKRPIVLITVLYIVIIVGGLCLKSIAFFNETEETIFIDSYAIIVSDIIEKDYNFQCKVKIKNNYFLLIMKKNKKQKCNLQYGDEINIKGNVEIASEARNYRGFNYRLYLKTQKIDRIITTRLDSINVISKNNLNPILTISYFVRNTINNRVNMLYDGDLARNFKWIINWRHKKYF